MSYTPTTWQTGDTITATALNKMENGIANAGGYDLVIQLNHNSFDSVTAATLVSGSFSAAEAKALNLEPLKVLVYGYSDDVVGYPYTVTFGTVSVYYDNYAADSAEHFIQILAEDMALSSFSKRLRLHVNPDNTCSINGRFQIQYNIINS